MAGAGTGVVSALVWYVAVEVVRRTGWLGWALDVPLVRVMRVRDLLVEEDPIQAGWEKWEERRIAAAAATTPGTTLSEKKKNEKKTK